MPMESAQLTQAALAALHPSTSTQSQPFNHAEACRLRGKILGVLIRSIRLEAQRSLRECAEFLHVDNQLVEEWEFGDQVPSLPQLELLSRYLKSGADGYPDGGTGSQPSSREQYLILRQRLIGAMLRAAREAMDLSIADLGAQTALDMDLLERYELGELQIPLSQLTALAQAVDQDLNYFVGTTGFAPKGRNVRCAASDGGRKRSDVAPMGGRQRECGFHPPRDGVPLH